MNTCVPERMILAATLLMLCAPVLIDLAVDPARRPFSYVAADTFYYLQVARNVATSGVPSFDGQLPTNGFHPMWQAVCSIAYVLAEGVGAERYCVLILVLIGLALIAASVLLLARALARCGRLNVSFLLIPFGVYALAVAPTWATRCLSDSNASYWNRTVGALPLFGTSWSYANGMESGLVLFWFGALAYLWTRPFELSVSRAAWFGAACAMLVLSRLDHGLLILPTVIAAAARTWLRSENVRATVALLVGFAAPIGGYLALSRALLGAALPLSGAAKSTFPYFTSEHLQHLGALWSKPSCDAIVVLFWRQAQLWIPLVAVVIYLFATVRVRLLPNGVSLTLFGRVHEFDRLLVPVAFGVLALGAYNILFVTVGAQGQWYFPVSTLFVTLAVISLLARLPPLSSRLSLAAALALLGIGLALFVAFRRPDFNQRLAWFYWEEAPRVRAFYTSHAAKFLEMDDGIVAFSLNLPAMSGTLMLDAESARARSQGKLFELAAARGYDRLASLLYAAPVEADRSLHAAAQRTSVLAQNQSFEAFLPTFEYISDNGHFAVVRMTPKAASPARAVPTHGASTFRHPSP